LDTPAGATGKNFSSTWSIPLIQIKRRREGWATASARGAQERIVVPFDPSQPLDPSQSATPSEALNLSFRRMS
jgi:hypothetical protein